MNLFLAVLLGIGLFFNLVGIIGLFRFPDVYSRLHAETKTTTFGTVFIALSVAGYMPYWHFSTGEAGGIAFAARIFVAVFLVAFTNATGSHAIARAAYLRGQKPHGAVVDSLEGQRLAEDPEEKK